MVKKNQYLKIPNNEVKYLFNKILRNELTDNNINFKGDLNLSDVFYLDNISIMDLKDLDILRIDHIVHIKDALEDESNSGPSELLSEVEKIIGCDCINSQIESCGIKEIGIIQTLLQNNRLKENSFLIIDEPEASLHPEWEIRFAEILVLLVKKLNIHIYLNSHSPMFIESIDAFTEYYDMMDDVNYYLTEESEIKGKYDFNKINSDELYKIYDNLGDPYDLIDQLRLRKRLGE